MNSSMTVTGLILAYGGFAAAVAILAAIYAFTERDPRPPSR